MANENQGFDEHTGANCKTRETSRCLPSSVPSGDVGVSVQPANSVTTDYDAYFIEAFGPFGTFMPSYGVERIAELSAVPAPLVQGSNAAPGLIVFLDSTPYGCEYRGIVGVTRARWWQCE